MFFLLPSSFFQSWLTQTSCCRTWTLRTFPAIAMTTFYRSSKTTEAISDTHKTFSDCLQRAQGGSRSVLDKRKDALPFSSSSCTVFIGQRRLTERGLKLKDTVGRGVPSHPAAILFELCSYTQLIFLTPHTGVCVHIRKRVVAFFIHVLFPFET